MKNKKLLIMATIAMASCALAICRLTGTWPFLPSWDSEDSRAQEIENANPEEALKLYNKSINDAASAGIPALYQLDIVLRKCNLLYNNSRHSEVAEEYARWASFAEKHNLTSWQAAFLVREGLNNHDLFKLSLIDKNDPAVTLKALRLRPGDPNIHTDFRSSCYKALGLAYLDNNDYTNAEKYLKQGIVEARQVADDQNIVDACNEALMIISIKQHKYQDAAKLYIAACSDHPAAIYILKQEFIELLDAQDPKGQQIDLQVKDLLTQKNFEDLDRYATKLRAEKSPLANGSWPIDEFMGSMEPNANTDATGRTNRLNLLKSWTKQCPDSDTAKVALATVLTSYGWEKRGSGTSETVTEHGWTGFRDALTEAASWLHKTKNRTADWYSSALRVGMGQQWDRKTYDRTIQECRQKFPQYYSVIFKKYYWLQPRWYGEEGEANKYLDSESPQQLGIAGDVLVARIAWSTNWLFSNMIKEGQFDWPRIKRGQKQIIAENPSVPFERAKLLMLAVDAGDIPTAQAAFDKWQDSSPTPKK